MAATQPWSSSLSEECLYCYTKCVDKNTLWSLLHESGLDRIRRLSKKSKENAFRVDLPAGMAVVTCPRG